MFKITNAFIIFFVIVLCSDILEAREEKELFAYETFTYLDTGQLGEPLIYPVGEHLVVGSRGGHRWVLIALSTDDCEQKGFGAGVLAACDISCVSFENGLLCVSSHKNLVQSKSDVYFLSLDEDEGRFESSDSLPNSEALLPSLPVALCDCSIIGSDSIVYVIGGKNIVSGDTVNYGWFLDTNSEEMRWQELPQWQGEGLLRPNLSIQHNGKEDCLFVYGGYSANDTANLSLNAYCIPVRESFESKGSQWNQLTAMPSDIKSVMGNFVLSQSHVMVAADTEQGGNWFGYNTITDEWFKSEKIRSNVLTVVQEGEGGYGLIENGSAGQGSNPVVCKIGVNEVSGKFGLLDYAGLFIFFAALIMMGLFFRGRESTTDDFFVAGGRIPAWAAAISIMGTNFSAISFLTVPGRAYSNDWVQFIGIITLPLLTLMQVYLFIPIYRKHKIVSVYDYLEKRFNYAVRGYGSLVFIFSQFARLGVVLYLPALTLSAVTGINIYLAVLTMGIVCVIYTVMGGIEAVIWTDVVQTVIIVLGVLLSFYIIVSSCDSGIAGVFKVGIAHDKFSIGTIKGDWTTSAIWVVVTGHIFWYMGSIGNQNIAQRFFSVSSRKEAVKSAWIHVMVAVPVSLLLYLLGTALFFYYKNNPERMNPTISNDAVLPWFVSMEIPAGIAGLIVAAIFAASMSSVDTSMNSSATVFITDFFQRFNKTASDQKCLRFAKIATLFIGIIGIAFALLMALLGDRLTSILDFVWQCDALMASSLGGVFVLGIFFKKANSLGAISGAVAGMIVLYLVKTYTDMSFFLYYATGVVTCVSIGFVLSLISNELKVLPEKK